MRTTSAQPLRRNSDVGYTIAMNKIHDSETPAHGQQKITACAFIHHEFEDGIKVFLPKRADTKGFLPGVYELPGGHIDYGEDLVEGLERELREELKMGVSVGDPFNAFTYQNLVKGSHSAEVVYFAQFTDPLDQITLNSVDHSGYRWFSEDDVIRDRLEIVPTEHVEFSQTDDPEYLAILRGFELLGGKALKFN